jgi:hypothetical protein
MVRPPLFHRGRIVLSFEVPGSSNELLADPFPRARLRLAPVPRKCRRRPPLTPFSP